MIYHFRELIINVSICTLSKLICVSNCHRKDKSMNKEIDMILVTLQIINNVKSYNNFYYFFLK